MRGTTFVGGVSMVIEECCVNGCGITFAITTDLQQRRLSDHNWFYCPNGHRQHYTGPTDADRLRNEQAKNTHLRDQLAAASHDAETLRVTLLRDRARFANGVCPCCNRYFANVHRHMTSQHPDYDVTQVKQHGPVRFRCSCGSQFTTLHGLRIHQGRVRRDSWTDPATPEWRRHLTRV